MHACFPADAPVLTARGFRAIETVAITDEVLTHRGRYRHIETIRRQVLTGEVCTVRLENAPCPLTCTPGLLVLSRIADGECEWTAAAELTPAHEVAVPFSAVSRAPWWWAADRSAWWIAGHMAWDGRAHCVPSSAGCRRCTPDRACSTHDPKLYIAVRILNRAGTPHWLEHAPPDMLHEFIRGHCGRTARTTERSPTVVLTLQRALAKLGYATEIIPLPAAGPTGELDGLRYEMLWAPAPEQLADSVAWLRVLDVQHAPVRDLPLYSLQVADDDSYIVRNVAVRTASGHR